MASVEERCRVPHMSVSSTDRVKCSPGNVSNPTLGLVSKAIHSILFPLVAQLMSLILTNFLGTCISDQLHVLSDLI